MPRINGNLTLGAYAMQSQKGFSLIETMVALAVAGILGASIPGALSMASRATIISNELTTAESVPRSQMHYVQSQPYDANDNPPLYAVLPNLPLGYSIVTPIAARLDPKGDGTANDDGLQQITVTVKHGTKVVFTIIDFKVNFNRSSAM